MKFFKNQYGVFFLLLLLASVIYHKWISFDIFAYGDWEFHFKETLIDIAKPSFWVADQGIGFENLLLWKTPFNFLYGLFGYLDVASNVAEKVTVLWPIVLLLPLASFLLIRNIIGMTLPAVIGSFIFSYNSYFLSIDTQGHQFLTAAAGFSVLAVYFFSRSVKEQKRHLLLIATLLLVISGFYDFRMAYIFIFLIFAYTIFFILRKLRFKDNFFIEWKPIYFFGCLFLLFVLLNIFWILPFLKINILTENGAVNRGLFGNEFFTLDKALYLSYPFWDGHNVHWFINQPIAWWLYFTTITAFIGLWLGRKNKEVLFFGCVSLVGIFLSKQISDPFGSTYLFLQGHLPGFNAFREASKFYVLVTLGYAVMISSFCLWVLRKSSWRFKYFYVGLIAILSLLNAIPLSTGSIGTMFVSRHVPNDYSVFNHFVQEQNVFFRVLGVPGPSRWNEHTIEHPGFGLSGMVSSDWKEFFGLNAKNSEEKSYVGFFNQYSSGNLLNISSVKYVIVPIRDTANDDDFFKYYGDRDFFIQELNKLLYLKKINIGTEELVVYENEQYRPHIYTTLEKETVYKEIPSGNADFHFKNPTEYAVSLKSISSPVYINFSEKYHPDWKIRVGEFHWLDVLIKKDYFLPDTFHSENDAKLNSFLIDPEYIKKNFTKDEYHENPDGSIDLELTLYFKPQSYFYLGLIVSGTTLVLCLSYLGYDFIKRRRKSLKEARMTLGK